MDYEGVREVDCEGEWDSVTVSVGEEANVCSQHSL